MNENMFISKSIIIKFLNEKIKTRLDKCSNKEITEIKELILDCISLSRRGMIKETRYSSLLNNYYNIKKELIKVRAEKNDYKVCLTLLNKQL